MDSCRNPVLPEYTRTRALSFAQAPKLVMASPAAMRPIDSLRENMQTSSLVLLRAGHRALRLRLQAKYAVVGGDEQRRAVLAPGQVGGGHAGQDAAEQRAIRGEHEYAARAGGEH